MRDVTYSEAVRECLLQKMKDDSSIFMLGEDIGLYGGAFGVSQGLIGELGPDRIMDTPISEQGIAGVAIGAALVGMRPIVEIMFSDFIMLPLEQIVNQAAKIRYMFGGKAKVPMVVRTPGGGGIGLAAQHSQSIEALFFHFPGLKVVMPSSAYDAKGLLSSSIDDDNPVIFFEHKLLYNTRGDVPEEPYRIPLGKGEVKREGSDITVVSTSYMVTKTLNVADKLSGEGMSVEVVDPRTIKPLDIGRNNRADIWTTSEHENVYYHFVIKFFTAKIFSIFINQDKRLNRNGRIDVISVEFIRDCFFTS